MLDPTGQIVTSYNGEIYNYRELRRELEREYGFCFRTACDTEILPFGYLAWGCRFSSVSKVCSRLHCGIGKLTVSTSRGMELELSHLLWRGTRTEFFLQVKSNIFLPVHILVTQ